MLSVLYFVNAIKHRLTMCVCVGLKLVIMLKQISQIIWIIERLQAGVHSRRGGT